MRVSKFYSVQDAYERMGFWGLAETVAAAMTVINILWWPRNGWVFVASATAWWLADKLRKTFHRLFWTQAEMLHTSSASGDPHIFRFMSKRDQRRLAQKSFDKFSQRRR